MVRGHRIGSEIWLIAFAVAASVAMGWLIANASDPLGPLGGPDSGGPVAERAARSTTAAALVDVPAPTPTTTTAAPRASTVTAPSSASSASPVASQVRVRVDATGRPTYLCVETGRGRQLFAGVLTGARTFRAEHLRFTVGRSTTRVAVNGSPVALSGSPSGLDVTRGSGAKPLAVDERPCSTPATTQPAAGSEAAAAAPAPAAVAPPAAAQPPGQTQPATPAAPRDDVLGFGSG